MKHAELRSRMVEAMIEYGEIIPMGEDFYEDMGGHIVHDSDLDSYIENFLKNLADDERKELIDGSLGVE